jgi:hypothetical protein
MRRGIGAVSEPVGKSPFQDIRKKKLGWEREKKISDRSHFSRGDGGSLLSKKLIYG